MNTEVETHKAPGRSHRQGIDLIELMDRFDSDDAARVWFESIIWPDGRICGHCDSTNTIEAVHRSMPYRCRDCSGYFSVKTGTAIESSKIGLRKWAIAIYLELTSLKGVSSMKLHRDLGVTQKTAWYMLHRIRESFAVLADVVAMQGPIEVDTTYIGGLEKNKHANKKLRAGRGPVGKAAVIGAADRATGKVTAAVVDAETAATADAFLADHAAEGAAVYTDEASAYQHLPNHEAVSHSAGEYVKYLDGVNIDTNAVESLWSTIKRAHKGVYHHLSAKHLQRYIDSFAAKRNIRDADTADQMAAVVASMFGRHITYRELVGAPQPLGQTQLALEPW
ncbi:MAG: IS1595 family transposase [Acidimicrobiaceae bacterium]|nr:IS1595 family transposase [Acidimicrobiaceae bacterium]MYE08490.1 IS1595 family transposase [Acidimicrobiaceae bacterium]MYI36319.1 IS1595 family transposase [Acidimicrobiaceae bacterium]